MSKSVVSFSCLVAFIFLAMGCSSTQCPRPTVQAPPPPPAAPQPVRVATPAPEPVEEWVHMPSQITFASNRSILTDDGEAALLELAEELREHEVVRVRIEGHINGERQTERGQQLSMDRAQVVMERLIQLGFDAGIFEATGHGGSQPVAATQTDTQDREYRRRNRRVELHALVRRSAS